MHNQVSNPLTLVMEIKSPGDFQQLNGVLRQMQSLPPEQNPIGIALTKIGTVHFARFAFLKDTHLAVITTYDGDFERYIDSFVNEIGPVFDQLLQHVKEAPALPVKDHPDEFKAFVRTHDVKCVGTMFSAYPDWRVQDLLTLIKQHGSN